MFASTNRLIGGAIGALVAVSALTAAPANAGAPRYDGMWSVSIVTQKGDGGSDPFTISGKVAPSGAITVTVSSGSKSATGSGHLAGNSGEGLWHGGACSGTWTAERRDGRDS
jgi:hypothetical protein